jgi:hypothetical protein
MLQFGKLYRFNSAHEDFMASTRRGWKFVGKNTMFVLLKEEDEHYVVLLSDGVIGNVYTNEGSLDLVTKDNI